MLSINDRIKKPDGPPRYAIGLDLGGTYLKYGVINSHGIVVYKNYKAARTPEGGKVVLSVMAEAAHECVMFAQKEGFVIEAVGAGCPGTIDSDRGVPLGPTPHIPDWEGAEIAKTISAHIVLPVFADNDANYMAYGEYAAGAGFRKRFVVGITLGTGIGGGIVLNGEIYRGAMFNGAELGHVVVEVDGRPCPCGNHGCLEKYAGGKSLVSDTIASIQSGVKTSITDRVKSFGEITPKLIFEEATKGDAVSKKIVDQMVKYLGAGISSTVNVLNPEIIIIGGGISNEGDAFISRIKDEILSRVMKPVRGQISIVRAALGNDAGVMGAGLYALQKVYKG